MYKLTTICRQIEVLGEMFILRNYTDEDKSSAFAAL